MSIKERKVYLDKIIREYFLLSSKKRQAKLGIEYFCPLDEKWHEAKKMNVCHYIDRNKIATRYEESNLLLCSEKSNIWDAKIYSDGISVHHRKFKNFIGEIEADRLKSESKKRKVLTKGFVEFYINYYMSKINEIKTNG